MNLLPADIQIKLLRELNYQDIKHLCNTSTYMKNFCGGAKYNRLWIHKLYEDFGMTYQGCNGYEKYKEIAESGALMQYNKILKLVEMFKGTDPNAYFIYPGGKYISRSDVRQLIRVWKGMHANVLPEEVINYLTNKVDNILYDIVKAAGYIKNMVDGDIR